MTMQMGEVVHYDGLTLYAQAEPLTPLLRRRCLTQALKCTSTALWRGYQGVWQICENQLFLQVFLATLKDGTDVDLEWLFPQAPENGVFAEWFSGRIKAPEGKCIVWDPYNMVLERTLTFEVKRGIVTSVQTRDNRPGVV